MSNQPLPPPYGGSYPPILPMNLHAAYKGPQQHNDPNAGVAEYWSSQRGSNDMRIAQNSDGFLSTAYPTSTNVASNPGGTFQPPFDGHSKIMSNGTDRSLLYPSIPYSFPPPSSSIPIPPNSHVHDLRDSRPAAAIPDSFSSVAPRFAISGNEIQSHLLNPAAPELEDGEISSGEQSNVSDEIYTRTPDLPRQVSQQGFSRGVLSRNLIPHGIDVDEDATSKENLVGSINDANSSKSNPSALQQAEALLRELQTYNVELQDLVTEGFDAKLLRFLFAHIGVSAEPINIPPHDLVTSHLVNDKKSSDPSHQAHPDHNIVSSSHPNHSLDMTRNQHSTTTEELSHPSGAPKQVDQTTEAAISGDNRLVNSHAGGKPGHKSTGLKTVDRKAYIAQMLAAKTGKIVSGSSTLSNTSKTPAEPTLAVHTHLPPIDITTHSDQPPILKSSSSANITTQPSTLSSGLEAKKRAQTELARQKMEALKIQREAQVKNQVHRSPRLKPLDKISTVSESLSSDMAEPTTGLSVHPHSVPVPRQASYFSPVSLKPAFNLPGLFSVSADTTSKDQRNEEQALLEAEGTDVDATKPAEYSEKDSASKASATSDKISGAANDYKSGSRSRKRQQAVDFINSPSTKLRKTFSHSEANSVVIDVSDDEDTDTLDSLSRLEGGNFDPGREPPNQENAEDHRKEHPMAEAPPLSAIPTRNPPILEREVPPPPSLPLLSQVHGRSQEPEVLKSKEMEIEQMNRKIAELEQRIRAKQTSGRTQSPSQLAKIASMQSTQSSTQGDERTPDAPRPLRATFDQSLQTKMPDISSFEVPSEPDKATNAGKKNVPAPEENFPNRVEPPTDNGAAESREFPAPIVKKADGGNFTYQAAEPSSAKDHLPEDNRIYKKAQLESNLADLGKEIIEIEACLQLRKVEMDRLQTNLNNVHHRREQLSQELASLAGALPPEQDHSRNTFLNDSDVQRTKQVPNDNPEKSNSSSDTHKDSLQKASGESISNLMPDHITGHSDTSPSDIGPAESANILSSVANDGQGSESSGPDDAATEKSSDEGLDEDGMDISRSEMDEGELSEAIQGADQGPVDPMDASEEDDFYEPPNEVLMQNEDQLVTDFSRTPLTDISRDPIGWNLATPHTGELVPQSSNKPEGLITTENAQSGTEHDIPSRTEAAENESEDYEPPEPSIMPEKSSLQVDRSSVADANDNYAERAAPVNGDSLLKPRLPQPQDDSQVASRFPEIPPDDNNPIGDSFTPYSSPLRYFKSYRFHPDFLKDVATGFRSLTYSNAINPQNPICQYEFGGVCNDESCANQHFHKMGLSDDIILREIGISEGATSEEKNKYKAGLRDLVLDLRRRKVKDLDAIASEISNYRARFLGDSPKMVFR